jgi:hypothetical protein
MVMYKTKSSKKGMFCKVDFVIRSMVAKKIIDQRRRDIIIILLFFVDFHFLELFMATNLTFYPLLDVHKMHGFSKKCPMVFVIAHKALIFPMGNIINININWNIVANNTSHDLGITIINLCTIINNKKNPNNL